MSRSVNWYRYYYLSKTCDTTCGEHVSMWAGLCAGSLFDFFEFSRRRLRYSVLSALDFGEFKRYHNSIYRNLRELSLFILYVNEHDFESPWPWEQLYFDYTYWLVLVATDRGPYPVEYCLESVEKYSEGKIHKSEPEPRNGKLRHTVCCIHQAKYSNQSHEVCLR